MENDQKILIIEDDIFAQEFLFQALKKFGFFNILTTTNAQDALNFCRTNDLDLIFMDINIAGEIDGIQCAREISVYYDTPIVFTTAYSDSNTIDEASDTNLFGYLIKPFTQKDLSIIIKIIQKQLFSKKRSMDKIQLSDNTYYNFCTKSLSVNNQRISLTKNEISIIELLINKKDSLVSYDQLQNFVWKKPISDSGIRDAFARLRKKVPSLPISTHFGSGYSLDLD